MHFDVILHDTLRIGPPPGGPDRRRITVSHRWFSTILSDFCINGVSKATPGTTKITRFYGFSQVGRRRAFFTIARPSFVFFVILWWIFGDFDLFFHPWREQSNTGNAKNQRVLMHFHKSSDGMRFWSLQYRYSRFFVVVLRWILINFDVILHDFGHPSGSLISVYEWSLEHVKMRNFHHFLKRFLPRKNRAHPIALRISWKK